MLSKPDIYYDTNYGRLYEGTEGGEYVKYTCSASAGTIIHPFIKRPIPWIIDGKQYFDIVTPYGYGGPLITELYGDSRLLIEEFRQAFEAYCQSEGIICEFIRFHPLYENALYCKGQYDVTCNRHTVAVDLTDPTFFSTQFDAKCRNMVRKAEKLGVAVEIDSELTTIDSFTDIYYKTMAKRSANDYYFFKHDYFHRIRDELKGESLIVNAVYEGEIVASSMFLYTSRSYAHYHLSATKPEFYKLAANNLIIMAACGELRKNGCTWLHLGGGLSSEVDDSLLAFKRSFGRLDKNKKEFYIGKKIWNEKAYDQVMNAFIREGGHRNTYFPEYRGRGR